MSGLAYPQKDLPIYERVANTVAWIYPIKLSGQKVTSHVVLIGLPAGTYVRRRTAAASSGFASSFLQQILEQLP